MRGGVIVVRDARRIRAEQLVIRAMPKSYARCGDIRAKQQVL